MIAIDTNLLIYAHRSHTPQHRKTQIALERACRGQKGVGVAYPSLLEFWSVVTHPAAEGKPSSLKEAEAFIHGLVDEGGVNIWMPHLGFWQRLLQVAIDLKVQGARLFDLQIALIAFDNGATEIWTHDANFLVIPGLKKYDPLSK